MEAIIPKFSRSYSNFILFLLLLRTKRIISLHPKYVKILKFKQKLLILDLVLIGLQEVRSGAQELLIEQLLVGEDAWSRETRQTLSSLGFIKVRYHRA